MIILPRQARDKHREKLRVNVLMGSMVETVKLLAAGSYISIINTWAMTSITCSAASSGKTSEKDVFSRCRKRL
jgi:hypothetical protein